EAIRPAGLGAWYVDRVHPSPLGHRHLAVTAGRALHVSLPEPSRPPPPPPPPPAGERAARLAFAGVPGAWRRGRDFLPGLVRAVVDDLRGAGVERLDLELPQVDTESLARAT